MVSRLDVIGKNLLWTEGLSVLIISTLTLLFFVLLSFIAKKIQYKLAQHLCSFLAYSALLFLCASFYFFRNPDRSCPEALRDPCVLISPADGHVVEIVPGEKAGDGFDTRVSIFLSPLDVHVNWMPMAGIITEINYTPGRFIAAFVPKSSELNERLELRVRQVSGQAIDKNMGQDMGRCNAQANGHENNSLEQDSAQHSKREPVKEILVRQIAGTLARRIVCWVKTGESVTLGQKYGMIKFGSRVDILLPKTVKITVQLNQKVYGGQTVLGRWVC